MASLSQKSDEELMHLYQQGDEAAFTVLYGRYAAKTYGYLRKRLPSDEAAADVFQAALMKLHQSRLQFDSKFPFAAWFFTISRTALFDWSKRQKAIQRTVEKIEQVLKEDTPIFEQKVPDRDALPAHVLDQLPINQRRAIEMRYLEDRSFEEIAKQLSLAQPNVRQLVHRGIARLKELLKKTETQ